MSDEELKTKETKIVEEAKNIHTDKQLSEFMCT